MTPIGRTLGARAQLELQQLRQEERVKLQSQRQEQREDTHNFWNMQMKQRQMDQAARDSSQNFQLKMAEMQGKIAGATGQSIPPEMLRSMGPMAGMGYMTGRMQGEHDEKVRKAQLAVDRGEVARDVEYHSGRMAGMAQRYRESKERHPYELAIKKGQAEVVPLFNQLRQVNAQIGQMQAEMRELSKLMSPEEYSATQAKIRNLQEAQRVLTSQIQAAGAAFGGRPGAGPTGGGMGGGMANDPDAPVW